jgi:hypothetical protein
VYWIPKKGPRRKHRCFAEVNLWRGALGPEVVTHELFHATMAYGYRIKFPFEKLADCTGVTKWEERLTYAHGRMCAQLAEVLDTE